MYYVPIVLQTTIGARNEGFHMVDSGTVEVVGSTLRICEKASNEIVLDVAYLYLVEIRFQKIVSEKNNYLGGKIELVGNLGRSDTDIIIMKMPQETYEKLKLSIKKDSEEAKAAVLALVGDKEKRT